MSEDATKVWKVIAKYREARRGLQAIEDAKGQLEKGKADYDKAVDDLFPGVS
jgi:hypothetical protein